MRSGSSFPGLLAIAAAVAVVSGCATSPSQTSAIFSNAAINGHPVRLAMDSGAHVNWLYGPGGGQLDLKSTPIPPDDPAAETSKTLTEPANIVVNTQTLSAPFVTIDLPWTARVLSWFSNFKDVDGAFGWPALRENILVFDGAHRTVNRSETLPEYTAGWLQLKVRANRSDALFLEIPMSDGATRTFLVDTGDPGGVTLSSPLWKTWRAAHPRASTTTSLGWFLGRTEIERREVAQADEVPLGPIVLTQVPVSKQTAYESDMKVHEGTLGLQALERMDMVVDGKNGLAYVQARPPTGVVKTKEKRTWAVADNVILNPAPQLAFAAHVHGMVRQRNGDQAGAIADFTRALGFDPNNTGIYFDRAGARENTGDHAGAIADATRALEIEPGSSALHALRGTARLNNRELDGAIADFDRAIELAPDNAGAHLFRGIAKASKGDSAGAVVDANRALELDPSIGSSYAVRASAALANRDFGSAVADFDRALKFDSNNASLYVVRGLAKFEQADHRGAIADFRRAAGLDPKTSSGGFSAGIALQSEGNYPGALAQYEKAIELNVSDAIDATLFRQLLLRRLGRPALDFSKTAAGWKDPWKQTLACFVMGGLDENILLTEAAKGARPDVSSRECETFYYLGAMRLIRADKAGAREFWQKCCAPEYKDSFASKLAGDELARLAAPDRSG